MLDRRIACRLIDGLWERHYHDGNPRADGDSHFNDPSIANIDRYPNSHLHANRNSYPPTDQDALPNSRGHLHTNRRR